MWRRARKEDTGERLSSQPDLADRYAAWADEKQRDDGQYDGPEVAVDERRIDPDCQESPTVSTVKLASRPFVDPSHALRRSKSNRSRRRRVAAGPRPRVRT